ncbi:SigE family RNA polymerase sigma factor [Plantactinospora soyae]|uniref:RNA polymerase sigma-70 factor (Sigma-E family) n=1 Tax=Plantactinospora soyae TaxID=1544732 RepID=A0A927LYU6_9ACTN|nr:SigE family RNA polymerase sigma factor [Plantactinospora soyae]MBE1484429.1 RNA polymerase sigma-70 factor (sigma-E family) [Plantactinospora soyae]
MTDRAKPLTAADESFVAFMESAWERHLRLAILLTGDRWRGEELLQDSLVKMYERWGKLSRHSDLHAYLRRALANNNTSMWRRRRRENLVADVPDRPSPVEADSGAEVKRALMALPPRQRAVVVLRLYEDLSERRVAETLGCPLGTVKSQYARALEKLRHLVHERNYEQARGIR